MKKTFIRTGLICFLFALPLFMQGQSEQPFRLSDYQNPDYHWKQLNLNFNLGGSSNHNFLNQDYGDDTRQGTSNFSGGFGALYTNTRNSRHYQGNQVLNLSGNTTSGMHRERINNEDDKDEHRNNNQYLNLGLGSQNRFYNDKKQFIEIDYGISGLINHSHDKYNATVEVLPFNDEYNHIRYRGEGTVAILLGFGRIEDVQDARLAKYILDDLSSSGSLARGASSEEILEFAAYITQLKNQRYFDSRLRKIAEITAIDSFMMVRGLRANPDAGYFTLVNDDWDFAAGPVRATGRRFSFGIMPGGSFLFEENTSSYRDTLNDPGVIESYENRQLNRSLSWGLDGVVAYVWERPASLSWQHSINTEARYSLFHQKDVGKYYYREELENENEYLWNTPNVRLMFSYELGFYPNTRTYLTLRASESYNQFWGEQKRNGQFYMDEDRIDMVSGLELNGYYYVSPQLRIRLILGSILGVNITKDDVTDPENVNHIWKTNWNTNFLLALTYSIF